ncbi:uncharacterized protein [Ptychodera flava]
MPHLNDPLNALFINLGNDLSADDVHKIKMLISDKVVRRELSKIIDSSELFLKLQANGVISRDNLGFLKEIFRCIQRPLLITKIEEFERESQRRPFNCKQNGKYSDQYNNDRSPPMESPYCNERQQLDHSSRFPETRKSPKDTTLWSLYKTLNDSLCSDEERKLRHFLMYNYLSKEELHELEDFTEILVLLEEKGIISETDLNLVKELLHIIQRRPLIAEIEKYERKLNIQDSGIDERTKSSNVRKTGKIQTIANGSHDVPMRKHSSNYVRPGTRATAGFPGNTLWDLYETLNNSISRQDEETIRYLLHSQLSKRELTELQDFSAILRRLEEKNLIGKNNLGLVKELLAISNRRPLIAIVEKFEQTV